MKNFKWIIIAGGGNFGNKAVDYAKKNGYPAIIIDNDPNCVAGKNLSPKFQNLKDFLLHLEDLEPNTTCLIIDEVSIISNLLSRINVEYIIPVVPIHLMNMLVLSFFEDLEVFSLKTNKLGQNQLLTRIDKNLVLFQNENNATTYLSYAKIDEICPENCAGPLNYCANFNREKPITITDSVKIALDVPNFITFKYGDVNRIVIIAESVQIKAGLGGIKVDFLRKVRERLIDEIDHINNKKLDLVVATTCNCHGVLNFLKNY